MKFEPTYYKERLEKRVINPSGTVGVVTLWSKWRDVSKKYRENSPVLFEKNSPIVLFSNLYGNGLPQMLANLAYNPQISRIAVIGNDSKIVPSYTYLRNFLEKGVDIEDIGEEKMVRIKETNFYIDSNLKPEYFRHIELQRFKMGDIESFKNFVLSSQEKSLSKKRRKIYLEDLKFTDFPSDITNHQVIANTPIDAWIELVYRMNRYGKNVMIKKGPARETRRILLDVGVTVHNPGFENDQILEEFNFIPEELREYRKTILSDSIPPESEYSYGNRLRAYWNGADTLKSIGKILKDNPEHNFAFTTLWDPSNDLIGKKASPCFTDAHFIKNPEDGKLMLIAGFRAQDLISAWLPNMYGLRSIQEFVSERANIEPGQINLRTRYLSIDPMSPHSLRSIAEVNQKRKRKKVVFDPKGNYVVEADKKKGLINVKHYSNGGSFLEEIIGEDAIEVKNKLCLVDAFSTKDHALWIGMELARAQNELNIKEENENR